MHLFRVSRVVDFCSSATTPCVALISDIQVMMQNRHTERPVHKFPALITMDRMYACFAVEKAGRGNITIFKDMVCSR